MKVEVCGWCDKQIDSDGKPGKKVDVMAQMALVRKGALKVTICVVCFQEKWRLVRGDLELLASKLRNALVNPEGT